MDILSFSYGDVLFRRRCVTEDVLLWRHSVSDMFCMEMFCRGDVLCRDVLYERFFLLVSKQISLFQLFRYGNEAPKQIE
jgi:hypothetical protein